MSAKKTAMVLFIVVLAFTIVWYGLAWFGTVTASTPNLEDTPTAATTQRE